MKKIISSLLALAMFVSVGVMFVGCDSMNGTYTASAREYTVITKITEDGKIEETKTLSFDEYYKVLFVWEEIDNGKTLEEALAYEFSEDEAKEFNDELNDHDFKETTSTITLKNGKYVMEMRSRENSLALDELMYSYEGTYEVEGDNMKIYMTSEAEVPHDMSEYKTYYLTGANYTIREDGSFANTYTRSKYRDEDYKYKESDIFSPTNTYFHHHETIYTEVK